MRAVLFASLAVLALAACAATGGSGFPPASNTGAGGSGTNTDTDINLGGGFVGTGGGSTGNGCSAAAELVYVLSTQDEIYSFDPPSKKFTFVTDLNCSAGALRPNSMAIDRNAVAWVNYVADDDSSGVIFRFNLNTKSCEANPVVELGAGWTRLGMGFSTDAANGASETLFVAGTADPLTGYGTGLGKINMTTHKVVPIGDFDYPLSGQSAELTGTGDAKLYGFFTSTPAEVAQIGKTASNGVVSISGEKAITGTPPQAWAFSFWGGSFYLYTSPDGKVTSTVTQYNPNGNTLNPKYTEAPIVIVGAGVSTCAPITPPA